ncbi:DUF4279 domain-containing protein [Candidatus Daviesbacteria bacterium]|nr:DUF4279 domain-containing protein [Candidatus Daviesbacteria bacterium]
MENAKDKTYVWFAIYDFTSSPEHLTQKIGLKPTEAWVKGSTKPFGKGKVIIRENTWKLTSSLPITESVEKHLSFLLETLRPYKAAILDVAEKCLIEFGCAIYMKDYNSGLHIDKKILKEIAEYNAELDVDIYSHRVS